MSTQFSNVEDGVESYEIAGTGDYLVKREGEWYYWLGSTSPRENFGPYPTAEAALAGYNGSDDPYTLADVDADPADLA